MSRGGRGSERKRTARRRAEADAGNPWRTRCRYCVEGETAPEVRTVDVALPPEPRSGRGEWRLRRLPIDRWPHRDGDVVKDPDGTYRKLTHLSDAVPGQPRFRIHSAEVCAGMTKVGAR